MMEIDFIKKYNIEELQFCNHCINPQIIENLSLRMKMNFYVCEECNYELILDAVNFTIIKYRELVNNIYCSVYKNEVEFLSQNNVKINSIIINLTMKPFYVKNFSSIITKYLLFI